MNYFIFWLITRLTFFLFLIASVSSTYLKTYLNLDETEQTACRWLFIISFIPIAGEIIGGSILFTLLVILGDRYVLKPLLEKIQKFNYKDIKKPSLHAPDIEAWRLASPNKKDSGVPND